LDSSNKKEFSFCLVSALICMLLRFPLSLIYQHIWIKALPKACYTGVSISIRETFLEWFSSLLSPSRNEMFPLDSLLISHTSSYFQDLESHTPICRQVLNACFAQYNRRLYQVICVLFFQVLSIFFDNLLKQVWWFLWLEPKNMWGSLHWFIGHKKIGNICNVLIPLAIIQPRRCFLRTH